MRNRIALAGSAIIFCASLFSFEATAVAALPTPFGVLTTGVLPIPAALAQRAEPYTKFRPSTLLNWHPVTSAALILRADLDSGREHLHIVAGSGAMSESFAVLPETVVNASFQPKDGSQALVRTLSADGVFGISVLDVSSRRLRSISPPGESAGVPTWHVAGEMIAFTTSATGASTTASTERSKLYIGEPRVLEGLKVASATTAGRWRDPQFSPNGKSVVYVQEDAEADSLWTFDIDKRQHQRISQGAPHTRYGAPRFAADGGSVWLTVKRKDSLRQLTNVMSDGAETALTTNPNADVVEFAISELASRIAVNATENGASALRFFDLVSRKELLRPALLPGEITGIRWIPTGGSSGATVLSAGDVAPPVKARHQLGFSLASHRAPRELFVYEIETTKLTRWTNGAVPGLNAFDFVEPSTLTWESAPDRGVKRTGQADLYLPDPIRFAGRRPVLIVLPTTNAAESPRGFIGKYQFLLNELGIAICYPSIDGAVATNIATLIDRIAEHTMLNVDRVIVQAAPSDDVQAFARLLQQLPRIAGGIVPGGKPSLGAPVSTSAPLFVVREKSGLLTQSPAWQISTANHAASTDAATQNFIFYAQLRFLQMVVGELRLPPQDTETLRPRAL